MSIFHHSSYHHYEGSSYGYHHSYSLAHSMATGVAHGLGAGFGYAMGRSIANVFPFIGVLLAIGIIWFLWKRKR